MKTGPDTTRSHREYYIIAAVFIAALIVKIVYLVQQTSTPFFYNLIIDEVEHDGTAQELLRRGLVREDAFYFAPLYPYMLAAFYSLFGRDLFAVKLVQAVLGAVNVVLVYFVGRHAFGDRRTALWAALLTMGYGVYYFYEGFLLKTTVAVFFTNLALLCLLLARNTDRKLYWLLAGLVTGLTSLLRGNILLVIPFVLLWIAWEFWKKGLSGIGTRAGLYCLGLMLAISPATIHNWAASGDFVLTTYQGGTNFYIGNHHAASGIYEPLKPNLSMPQFEKQDAVEIATEALGGKPSPSEISRYWFGRSFEFIGDHPGEFLELTYRKLRLFLNGNEIADDVDYRFFRGFSTWFQMPRLSPGLIFPLAFMGIVFSLAGWRRHRLLYIYILASSLSVVLFFVFSRYRVPVMSGFILMAAYGMTELWRSVAGRQWRRVSVACAVFALFLFYSNQELRTYSPDSSYSNLGAIYLNNKQYDLAIEAFENALEIDPDHVPAIYNLGIAYQRKGEYRKALENFRRAQKANPEHPPIYHAMGQVLMDLRRWDEAVGSFRKVIELDPDNTLGLAVMAYNNMGTIYLYQLKDRESAVRCFRRSLEISPDQPQAEQIRRLIR